ncbi:ribosomal protein S18-alanine N-acetyltransferase [Persicimonas caeni]|nr:ribosomal protein S18-alanine N-acetyltransferase [Persicimonas caeni]
MSWRLDEPRLVREGDALRVREAGADDLEAILAIEETAHPTPWIAEVFEREMALDWSYLWLFERGNKAVGFLVFWVIHDEVHILNVAVDPACRRQGIATAVLVYLVEIAEEHASSFVTLEVREHNQAAIALYESLGFEIIGKREQYYADTGEDAFIMSCIL